MLCYMRVRFQLSGYLIILLSAIHIRDRWLYPKRLPYSGHTEVKLSLKGARTSGNQILSLMLSHVFFQAELLS